MLSNWSVTLHFVPRYLVPGHFVPVTLSPGDFSPVTLSPGTLSPGLGLFVPWSLCPLALCPLALVFLSPGHFVPGHFVPGHVVPSHFVPGSFCPPVTLSPVISPRSLGPYITFLEWLDMYVDRDQYETGLNDIQGVPKGSGLLASVWEVIYQELMPSGT
jgi:hypothetical protein